METEHESITIDGQVVAATERARCVTVCYTTNVYAVIEDGQVARVVVDDENLSAPAYLSDGLGRYCEPDRNDMTAPRHAWAIDALKMADDTEWPSWEFG